MPWWMLLAVHGPRFCLDEAGDGKGGGGGSGDAGKKPEGDKGAPDLAAKIAALEAENAALKAAKGKPNADDEDDEDDLLSKATKNREKNDRSANDSKAMEAALRFTMGANTFLKDNASLLPKDIADIFKAADAEKFDNEKQKADAIKAGVIQSFFKQQANLDLLTPGLKSQLEDYLKLTKDGKEQEATRIFDSIFEPTFEMLRRVKKAEALGKGYSGHATGDEAYKEKLMRGSRKHHLGEKV